MKIASSMNIRSVVSPNDGIPVDNLKKCVHLLGAPFCHLINKYFEEAIFSECFKTSIVVIIIKSGDRSRIENYRPC